MLHGELFSAPADGVLKTFNEIHNFIYANDGLSEQEILDEFVKILFVKFADDKHGSGKFKILQMESENLRAGAKANGFTRRIEDLLRDVISQHKDFFDGTERIGLSAQSLAVTIQKLQKLDLHKSTNDAKGLAFQKFLGRHAKEGRGQFFTPEPVIDFCVGMLKPGVDEKIIDPACGSGGFLFSVLKHIQRQFPGVDLKQYTEQQIFGIEINRRVSQISKMKFMLECEGRANIVCANSLDDFAALDAKFGANSHMPPLRNGFDIVLTNPPFGAQGRITNRGQLSKYDLGCKWDKCGGGYAKSKILRSSQIPDVLFVERCLQLLRPGGRMAIVLPNGHFENSSMEYVRTYVREKAHVLAVVHLPQETFVPFGTGVKASLLFLQKKGEKDAYNGRVFFSKIEQLGYHGNKNGTPAYQLDEHGRIKTDSNGNPAVAEDFSVVIKDYELFNGQPDREHGNSFAIGAARVTGRFDYEFYSPQNNSLVARLKQKGAVKLSEIAVVVKQRSDLLKHNSQVEYIELSDVSAHSLEIVDSALLSVHELPSRASYALRTGDVITAVAGNSIGTEKHATAYVSEEFDKAICTNGFRILRDLAIDPYYLLYYLRSRAFLRQVFMHRTGAAIPALSDVDLENILVYIPPEKEVEAISQRVQRSFELRKLAKQELGDIRLGI